MNFLSCNNEVEKKEKIELLRTMICKGATDEEMQLFMHLCIRTGLDPFAKQICAIKRYDSKLRREVMTPQVTIDGLRLIAERTGMYAPGRPTEFQYFDDHKKLLLSATAYIKKLTKDGTWHEVSATAFFGEYAATKSDGMLNAFWAKMPHVMISKCAEALALRRAFPAEMSGLYTREEMEQAEHGAYGQPADLNNLIIERDPNEEEKEVEAYLNSWDDKKEWFKLYMKMAAEKREISLYEVLKQMKKAEEENPGIIKSNFENWLSKQTANHPQRTL